MLEELTLIYFVLKYRTFSKELHCLKCLDSQLGDVYDNGETAFSNFWKIRILNT
jgi:hypothetical protein